MIKIICSLKEKELIIANIVNGEMNICPMKLYVDDKECLTQTCETCINNNIDWILTDDWSDCVKCKHFQKKITDEPCMNCIHNNKFERND